MVLLVCGHRLNTLLSLAWVVVLAQAKYYNLSNLFLKFYNDQQFRVQWMNQRPLPRPVKSILSLFIIIFQHYRKYQFYLDTWSQYWSRQQLYVIARIPPIGNNHCLEANRCRWLSEELDWMWWKRNSWYDGCKSKDILFLIF